MRVAGGRAAESIVCANAYFSDLCALEYKSRISAIAYIDILYAFAYDRCMDTIARTPQQLGAGIKRYRRQKNLTQGNLGGKMRARQATVYNMEAGLPDPQVRI